MQFLPVVCGAVFLILFIMKCKNERSVTGVFLKNAASVFFILTAICSCYQNPDHWRYGMLIISGLVFGMLGDVYLDLKWVYPNDMKKYLIMGFTCTSSASPSASSSRLAISSLKSR